MTGSVRVAVRAIVEKRKIAEREKNRAAEQAFARRQRGTSAPSPPRDTAAQAYRLPVGRAAMIVKEEESQIVALLNVPSFYTRKDIEELVENKGNSDKGESLLDRKGFLVSAMARPVW